jgi:hypothetical protein
MNFDGDPMYQLIMKPETIDEDLIKKMLAIINKKYGKQMRNNKLQQSVYSHLISIEDHTARFFAIMYILVWEHEIRNGFEDSFSCGPNTLFGTNSRAHFKQAMGEVSHYMDMTNKFHFNDANAPITVEEFKKACIVRYITK